MSSSSNISPVSPKWPSGEMRPERNSLKNKEFWDLKMKWNWTISAETRGGYSPPRETVQTFLSCDRTLPLLLKIGFEGTIIPSWWASVPTNLFQMGDLKLGTTLSHFIPEYFKGNWKNKKKCSSPTQVTESLLHWVVYTSLSVMKSFGWDLPVSWQLLWFCRMTL